MRKPGTDEMGNTEAWPDVDVDNSYVARILKLTTLAPDIIEAILNGEEPAGLSLAKLTRTFPVDCEEQWAMFGFTTD